MRNINEYKRRFNTLLESTMGNVKPLISEAPQFEEFVVPTLDMVKDTDVLSLENYKGDIKKLLGHEKTFNGNEYKITLPEGMYDAGEDIQVIFYMDPILMFLDEFGNKVGISSKSDNVILVGVDKWSVPSENIRITFQFKMPNTQKELKENSPFITYVDFRCKNVKGGKIKFTVEVPSGSEIYEKPEDVDDYS